MTPTLHTPAAASFRDPGGQVVRTAGRILRVMQPEGAAELKSFLDSAVAGRWLSAGRIVSTRMLRSYEIEDLARQNASFRSCAGSVAEHEPAVAEHEPAVAEHEKVAFPSFPYEWPPEMLHAAATLTLDLAIDGLDEGIGLKDATPYNVLFRGPVPVFVDMLSFERRDPGDYVWLAYSQFVRTFLLPLLAYRSFGLPLDQTFLTRRDGLEPDELYRLASWRQRLSPSFLGLVTVPRLADAYRNPDATSLYHRRATEDPEKARFILRSLLHRLRRSADRLAPAAGRESHWSNYTRTATHYSAGDAQAKEAFVRESLDRCAPKRLLDIGCNTGQFSEIAAASGAEVVALDRDAVAVGKLWRKARSREWNILPLIVDIGRPSPNMGWRCAEQQSFLERACGHFDTVLMLAVLHHLLVTDRVPLDEIMRLAADLTTGHLVIEFVAPEDPMFRRLTRGREELHKDLTRESFEAAWSPYFELVNASHVHATRSLYLLARRRS